MGSTLAGGVALATTATDLTTAQQQATITFNDQESDGESVVIASASTAVDARLLVVTGTSQVFRELQLDAGTEFTDRNIDLTEPIQESQTIRAELRTADGTDELLARDRALIAVGESLAAVRSPTPSSARIELPNGRVELVTADPDAGFHYPYLLYKPNIPEDTTRPLFVITNNNPPVRDRRELITQLEQDAKGALRPAHTLKLPGLVAGFPRTPNDGPDMIQGLRLPSYRSDVISYTLERVSTDEFPETSLKRVDKQLIAMINDARSRLNNEGYTLTEQIHMNGFSSSGQFAARFAFLYPDLVEAISPGGNGAYPLPKASMDGIRLPFPLGTADYQTLTGREFDREAWTETAQFIFLGQEDQPLPSTNQRRYYQISLRDEQKAVEVFGKNRVTERLPVTKTVYNEAGADATFKVYDDLGHIVANPMVKDYTDFHRDQADITNTSRISMVEIGGVVSMIAGVGYLLRRRIQDA